MKDCFLLIIGSILLACILPADAQGTFGNLNFEDATIVQIPGQPYAVTVQNALPDWSVEYGNVQQAQIMYNDPSLGGTAVNLIANGYPSVTGETPVDGDFSVLFQVGRTSISLSQTGQIPTSAQSLLFEWAGVGPEPGVSVGNDSLTLFPVGSGVGMSGVNYTIYGANISAWAGQTEQLSFSANTGVGLIDDISFSPNPIGVTPEPDAFTLMGIGGALFAAYRRFVKRKSS